MTFKEFERQYALGSLDRDILVDLSIKTESKEILAVLSNNEDWLVRYWVALNKNTPAGVLEKLSADKDWQVRDNVAYNTNTPAGVLEILSKDEDWNVKDSAISNPNWKG